MAKDYEKLFSTNVWRILNLRLNGKPTVWVKENTLYIKMEAEHVLYEVNYPDFAENLCCGIYSSEDIGNNFVTEYRRYVTDIIKKKYFK